MMVIINDVNVLVWILAIISVVISIILRHKVLLLSQLSSVIAFFIVLSSVSLNISPFIFLVQIVVSLYGLIQYKKAADYNYQLVMEKTHQSPRTITRNGNFGDEHHRWRSA